MSFNWSKVNDDELQVLVTFSGLTPQQLSDVERESREQCGGSCDICGMQCTVKLNNLGSRMPGQCVDCFPHEVVCEHCIVDPKGNGRAFCYHCLEEKDLPLFQETCSPAQLFRMRLVAPQLFNMDSDGTSHCSSIWDPETVDDETADDDPETVDDDTELHMSAQADTGLR